MSQKVYYYFLQTIPGIGTATATKLLQKFGDPENIVEAKMSELEDILSAAQLKSLDKRRKDNCIKELQEMRENKNQYFCIADEEYPKRLRNIPDAPIGIFVKGQLPMEEQMAAAVVGTRNHSGYGESMAKEYAKILALCGVNVISGMARGIDGIAQRSALLNQGNTYAVLGCGTDVCYPPNNRILFEKIPQTGALISEYMPDTVPKPAFFPRRNRIISGLSDFIIVIEAREKSGTLITVDTALEQGKDVYVLPGRVTDPLSLGCNRLIRQGAHILPEPDTFYKELQETMKGKEKRDRQIYGELQNLNDMEKKVYDMLEDNPLTTTAILQKLKEKAEQTKTKESYQIHEISITLIALCVKKLAKQMNGTMFMRQC